MSLILDALRKSEAERRRGQSPSLYSASPMPTTRARPEWLRWLPLVALAVLVIVALFAWRGEPGPATRDELEADAGSTAPETDAADTEIVEAPEPAVAVTAPPPPARAAGVAAAPAPTVDSLVKPTPAPPTATAPLPTPSIVAETPAPAPTEAPAPAGQVPAEQLPPLAVLDTGTRSSLPPLKLSMHVFNSEPSRRFAIIDGQRVTEGAQLGSATVVEIRRDGVVLDISGRRVLLPRP
jgi:general secretion pathway protein B